MESAKPSAQLSLPLRDSKSKITLLKPRERLPADSAHMQELRSRLVASGVFSSVFSNREELKIK